MARPRSGADGWAACGVRRFMSAEHSFLKRRASMRKRGSALADGDTVAWHCGHFLPTRASDDVSVNGVNCWGGGRTPLDEAGGAQGVAAGQQDELAGVAQARATLGLFAQMLQSLDELPRSVGHLLLLPPLCLVLFSSECYSLLLCRCT